MEKEPNILTLFQRALIIDFTKFLLRNSNRGETIMINKTIGRCILLAIILFAISLTGYGQYMGKKNTIKMNITNPLIFGSKALIFGYERTVGKKQSFCFNIGHMWLREFGRGKDNDSIKLNSNTDDKGFSISGEYRFYLQKENKYEAPRGVYLGTYYSYNYFARRNSWTVNTNNFQGEVGTNFSMDIHTIGGELGYQFILWKRFSIDLVLIGPGVGFYNFKAKIDQQLGDGQEELFYEKLNDFLSEKIPGYDMVFTGDGFRKNGNYNTTTWGFRYIANIGFRF